MIAKQVIPIKAGQVIGSVYQPPVSAPLEGCPLEDHPDWTLVYGSGPSQLCWKNGGRIITFKDAPGEMLMLQYKRLYGITATLEADYNFSWIANNANYIFPFCKFIDDQNLIGVRVNRDPNNNQLYAQIVMKHAGTWKTLATALNPEEGHWRVNFWETAMSFWINGVQIGRVDHPLRGYGWFGISPHQWQEGERDVLTNYRGRLIQEDRICPITDSPLWEQMWNNYGGGSMICWIDGPNQIQWDRTPANNHGRGVVRTDVRGVDQEMEALVSYVPPVGTSNFFMIGRVNGQNDYIGIAANTDKYVLYRKTTGFQQLGEYAAPAEGDIIKLVLSLDQAHFFVNGTEVITADIDDLNGERLGLVERGFDDETRRVLTFFTPRVHSPVRAAMPFRCTAASPDNVDLRISYENQSLKYWVDGNQFDSGQLSLTPKDDGSVKHRIEVERQPIHRVALHATAIVMEAKFFRYWEVTDEFRCSDDILNGDIAELAHIQPASKFDLQNCQNVTGDIGAIAECPAVEITLAGNQLSACSATNSLFPNATLMDLSGNQFDEQAVDNILHAKLQDCVNGGPTGGTLNLTGNAAPSDAGKADAQRLRDEFGWTVDIEGEGLIAHWSFSENSATEVEIKVIYADSSKKFWVDGVEYSSGELAVIAKDDQEHTLEVENSDITNFTIDSPEGFPFIAMPMSELKGWPLVSTIGISGCEITGDIQDLGDGRVKGSLWMGSNPYGGDVANIAGWPVDCNDVDISWTSVFGDVSAFSTWKARSSFHLSSTNVAGNLSSIKTLEAVTCGFRNSNISEVSDSDTLFPNCTNLDLRDTPLSSQSVDNVLVAKDNDGLSDGTLRLTGTAPPSQTGLDAKASLEAKGWTVEVDGAQIQPVPKREQ